MEIILSYWTLSTAPNSETSKVIPKFLFQNQPNTKEVKKAGDCFSSVEISVETCEGHFIISLVCGILLISL